MAHIIPHITLESGKHPQHCIIWLHGLGADGQDFVPIVGELTLPVPIRYIFPHAPHRPVTINGGLVMRAWYDIALTSFDAQQDEDGIYDSQGAVEALIEHEVARGLAPGNIFLAGFSQGGAIALHTALRQTAPLGGVLALSTYLPLVDYAIYEAAANARQTPIFMAHGYRDQVVPQALGAASRDTLLELGFTVEWHEYGMSHSLCEEELRDIETWLARQIMPDL